MSSISNEITGPAPKKSKLTDTYSNAGDKLPVNNGNQPVAGLLKKWDVLKDVQLKMDFLNDNIWAQKVTIDRKYAKEKKTLCEERINAINCLPNFWTRVICCHPSIHRILRTDDFQCFQYLTNLHVDNETVEVGFSFSIQFHFKENPFFANEVLTKEMRFTYSGRPISKSTHIVWKKGKKNLFLPVVSKSDHLGFFAWFINNENPWCIDNVSQAFTNDIWMNPMPFYLDALQEAVKSKNATDDSR